MAADPPKNQNVGWRFPFGFSQNGGVARVGGRSTQAPSAEEMREALRVNAQHLLLTGKRERVMNPNFGIDARIYVFMPMTSKEPGLLKTDVEEQFQLWVDRVDLEFTAVRLESAEGRLTMQVGVSSVEFPVETLANVVM